MKCGMELLAITKEAERLKELRRLEEQAEAERLMQVRKEETIQWCDTVLSEYLEKLAFKGELSLDHFSWEPSSSIEMKFYRAGRYNKEDETLRPLKKSSKTYSDGSPSMYIDSLYLDTETIVTYCEEHCILVKLSTCNYRIFGSGWKTGTTLQFKLSPECVL